MAWIEQRRRADGGLTARVIWRPGGARDATRVWETFGAGSDAQNLARADGFKRMVEAAGQRWPDGWVRGGPEQLIKMATANYAAAYGMRPSPLPMATPLPRVYGLARCA
jgi:hypothetical protein